MYFQVNPLRQTHISGEVNIVRYISRLFPLSSPYNYEASGTFAAITEVDHMLDQLARQLADGNNKERQAALRQLNGRYNYITLDVILFSIHLIFQSNCTGTILFFSFK